MLLLHFVRISFCLHQQVFFYCRRCREPIGSGALPKGGKSIGRATSMRTGGRTIRNNVSNCMFRPPSLLGMTITSCGLMEVAVELLLGVPLCCMVLWVAAQMIRILSSCTSNWHLPTCTAVEAELAACSAGLHLVLHAARGRLRWYSAHYTCSTASRQRRRDVVEGVALRHSVSALRVRSYGRLKLKS